MYQLYFYVPESHKEMVKEACFGAGAGTIGEYSRCSWEVKGSGQFLPGDASTPFLGRERAASERAGIPCGDGSRRSPERRGHTGTERDPSL